MSIDFSMRVEVPSDTLINTVGDESVLLNLSNEQYYGLDDVGSRMWAAITTSPSIQAAYEHLLGTYDVEADRLRQDLQAMVEELLQNGLIGVHRD